MGCLRAKPVVDGLEDELGGKAIFLRADLTGDVGGALGERYGIDGTPGFVVFDHQGRVVHKRVGGVPARELRAAIAAAGR